MRGAPHVGFSRLILRIRSRVSRAIAGRPGRPRRTFHVQNKQKPLRCQATTVSGWTMARAERQSLQTRDRMSHNRRSAGVSFGRCFTERFKTLTWWRRARFSNSTAARERKADRKRVIKIGRTRIETELRGGGNLHHLREIGISDRHTSDASEQRIYLS